MYVCDHSHFGFWLAIGALSVLLLIEIAAHVRADRRAHNEWLSFHAMKRRHDGLQQRLERMLRSRGAGDSLWPSE